MNEKNMLSLQKQEERLHAKKWIVTICAILLCFIDQMKGSAYGNVTFVTKNFTGLAVAAMVLIHYGVRDFIKAVHLIWSAVFLIGFFMTYDPAPMQDQYALMNRIVVALNILIWGHIAIVTLCHYLSRRRLPRMHWFPFALWILMMLGMIFSRYDDTWPLWFFVMFGCFYLTEHTPEEKDCIFDGLLNGIILSFFILQGFAVCYRMFDNVRYNGMYTNCNINALFYLIVEAAILGKWYRFVILDCGFPYKLMACIGNGILIAFCAMTLGRTALAVMLVNFAVVLFLMLFADRKYRLSKISLRFAGVVIAAIYSFPLVFGSLRYIPVHLASPMLFGAQYSAPITIQNFSEDSKSLVSMELLIREALGRMDDMDYQDLFDFLKINRQSSNPLFPVLIARASSAGEPAASPAPVIGSGTSPEDPLYSSASQINKFNVRVDIYKGYLSRLNYSGHEISESDLWITKKQHFNHCHNVLLQMLYNFGWVPGILFGCMGLMAFFYYLFRCIFSKDSCRRNLLCCLLFVVSFWGFGMFELDWEFGQMPLTLFFLSCYYLFQKGAASKAAPSKQREESLHT